MSLYKIFIAIAYIFILPWSLVFSQNIEFIVLNWNRKKRNAALITNHIFSILLIEEWISHSTFR